MQDLTKIPQAIREEKIRAFRHPKPVSGIILFGSWPSATFYVKGYNPCCSEGSSKAPEACAHMYNGELQCLCVHVSIPRERGGSYSLGIIKYSGWKTDTFPEGAVQGRTDEEFG